MSEELQKSVVFEILVQSGSSHDINDKTKTVCRDHMCVMQYTYGMYLIAGRYSRHKHGTQAGVAVEPCKVHQPQIPDARNVPEARERPAVRRRRRARPLLGPARHLLYRYVWHALSQGFTIVVAGSAFLYLSSLAYQIEADEKLAITNYQGANVLLRC